MSDQATTGETKDPGVPPRAALNRFKNFLESGHAASYRGRNFSVNLDRVDSFIKRPEKDWSYQQPVKADPVYNLPGVYKYDGLNESSLPSTHPHVTKIENTSGDMEKMLGTKSRFGDGSGSRWDQWILTATDMDSRNEFDVDGLPRIVSISVC